MNSCQLKFTAQMLQWVYAVINSGDGILPQVNIEPMPLISLRMNCNIETDMAGKLGFFTNEIIVYLHQCSAIINERCL